VQLGDSWLALNPLKHRRPTNDIDWEFEKRFEDSRGIDSAREGKNIKGRVLAIVLGIIGERASAISIGSRFSWTFPRVTRDTSGRSSMSRCRCFTWRD
jgi:hypothetical protein